MSLNVSGYIDMNTENGDFHDSGSVKVTMHYEGRRRAIDSEDIDWTFTWSDISLNLYNYNLTCDIDVDGTTKTVTFVSPRGFGYDQGIPQPGNISFSTKNDGSTIVITLTGKCDAESHGGDCTPADGVWVHGKRTPIILRLRGSNIPDYEPYKKPTIKISTNEIISIYNQQRSITVEANTSGDTNPTNVDVYVNSRKNTTSISNDKKDFEFKPSDNNVSDGQLYDVYAIRTHSKNTSLSATSNTLNLQTYRTPKISNFKLSTNSFSGTGNVTLNWTTNGRRWATTQEKDFKTYIKFGSDNVWFLGTNHNHNYGTSDTENVLTQQTQTLTKSIIDQHFSVAQRSQASVSTTIQMKRRNESSGVEAITSAQNITVQMYPKYRPDTNTNPSQNPSSLVFKRQDNNGTIIPPGTKVYIDEVPLIYVQWTYPSNLDGGIIDGYIVRIYDNSNNLVKTYTITTTDKTKSQIVNTANDLKRGELNHIVITAFYTRPDNNTKVEGPQLVSDFVIPLGKLHKPVISYPINNTQWHNTQFRILLELPEDDDYNTYDNTTKNNYVYRNIEVKINNSFVFGVNNTSTGITTGCISAPEAFSTVTFGYKKRICINPSLVNGFPISNTYRIAVRVQKNYYDPLWSKWSDDSNQGVVIITQTSISTLDLKVGDYILDSHYNQMRSYSIRLKNVYPITPVDSNNITVNKGDIIYRKEYQGVYNTVKSIQTDVNNWAVYDSNRTDVKFTHTINELDNPNPVAQEIITSLVDPRPNPNGRNYINLLINCMNKLY